MEELFSELLKEKKQNLEAQCVELESQNKKTLMFQRETSILCQGKKFNEAGPKQQSRKLKS